jgi:hypothetical protein
MSPTMDSARSCTKQIFISLSRLMRVSRTAKANMDILRIAHANYSGSFRLTNVAALPVHVIRDTFRKSYS